MNLIKRNIKLIIAFTLGGIVFGTLGVVAYSVYANSVTYDNTTSEMQATNVNDAIDELYTRTNQLNTYKDFQCPGCVYRKSTTTKYNSNSSGANGTNNKLSSSEYTTDYTTLNSNYFLGYVIDSRGYILSSYACGINNGIFFCLRGVDSGQSTTYLPFFQENVNRMNKAYPGCNATTSSSPADCSGEVSANIGSGGGVRVYSGSNLCRVSLNGDSYCT